MTIYRYGPLAWFWRFLVLVGVLTGVAASVLSVRWGQFLPLLVSLPILAPAILLSMMVAVQVDSLDGERLQVVTLCFWRRRVRRDRLRAPRYRERAQSNMSMIYAPRAWIPVRGGLPIFLDLLAGIPDREAFLRAFALPGRFLPARPDAHPKK